MAATARAQVAGAILMLCVRRLPPRAWLLRIAMLGCLNFGGFFALLFLAASRLPGGLAAVITSGQPLLVLGLSPVLLGVAVRAGQVLTALVSVAGIALLVLGATVRLDLLGVTAALGAAVCTALGLVLTRRWAPPVGVWTLTAWQLCAGGVLLLPVLLAVEGLPTTVDGRALAGFAWLIGPSTIGGYYLWFAGVRRLPTSAVAALGLLSPVTATVLGWALLGQRLGPIQCGGALLALGAVLALQQLPAGIGGSRDGGRSGGRRGGRPRRRPQLLFHSSPATGTTAHQQGSGEIDIATPWPVTTAAP